MDKDLKTWITFCITFIILVSLAVQCEMKRMDNAKELELACISAGGEIDSFSKNCELKK